MNIAIQVRKRGDLLTLGVERRANARLSSCLFLGGPVMGLSSEGNCGVPSQPPDAHTPTLVCQSIALPQLDATDS